MSKRVKPESAIQRLAGKNTPVKNVAVGSARTPNKSAPVNPPVSATQKNMGPRWIKDSPKRFPLSLLRPAGFGGPAGFRHNQVSDCGPSPRRRVAGLVFANREKILAKEYRKFEGQVVAKDGRRIPVLIHGNNLRNDKGEIIGNMAFVTDMTEHKKALTLAGEVQKSLLPQAGPQIQGLDIAGRNISCEKIGGDYFDFLLQQEYPNIFSLV